MAMPSFVKGWYLLYTNPKQERKIAKQLSLLNIDYYLPIVRKQRRWSDRVKTIDVPLFPCYIFIYLKETRDYYTSLEIKGALYYIRFGGKLARVPDSILNDLKMIIATANDISVYNIDFKRGQELIIANGPLAGLNCEVVSYKNRQMILVRIILLQRSLLVEVPVYYLSKF